MAYRRRKIVRRKTASGRKRTYSTYSRYGAKRRRSKRSGYGRKKKSSNFANIANCKTPLPNKLVNHMKYQDYKQVEIAGCLFHHIWRLNSIFDPDKSTTGSSVPMYDDMYTYYNLSKVLSNTFTFTYYVPTSVSRAMRVIYILSEYDVSAQNLPATYDVTALPGFIGYQDVSPNAFGKPLKFKRKINITRWLKRLKYRSVTTDTQASVQTLWAPTDTDPVQDFFLNVFIQFFDEDISALANYDYSINMDFKVMWARTDPAAQFSAFDNNPALAHGATGVTSSYWDGA